MLRRTDSGARIEQQLKRRKEKSFTHKIILGRRSNKNGALHHNVTAYWLCTVNRKTSFPFRLHAANAKWNYTDKFSYCCNISCINRLLDKRPSFILSYTVFFNSTIDINLDIYTKRKRTSLVLCIQWIFKYTDFILSQKYKNNKLWSA